MFKRLLAVAFLFAPTLAFAEGAGPKDNCIDLELVTSPVIDTLALTASRSFTYTQQNSTSPGVGFWKTMEVWFTLVDANTSITRLDLTCTGSTNDNTTLGTPLDCTSVSAGVATCSTSGVFRLVSPGSGTFHFPIDISRVPDLTCTFSVGTGSATAVIDTIKAWRRVCAS